tara:strand:+ start:279 stop:437 length:159 start_codon:yes stop_codon:yes gene_type:complete
MQRLPERKEKTARLESSILHNLNELPEKRLGTDNGFYFYYIKDSYTGLLGDY